MTHGHELMGGIAGGKGGYQMEGGKLEQLIALSVKYT